MAVEKLERPTRLDDDGIAALRELFPAAFSEGRVNLEALRDELADHLDEVEPGDEHYGLSWPGKRAAKRLAAMAPSGTLAPAPGEGVDETSTQNLIIEGENLEVLRILQKAYAGRVKLIYIDPPYNTGNDFVYKDDFKEPVEKYLEASGQADMAGLLTSNPKSSGRYHSAWLSMMYSRLRVAHSLLKDEGVIFISIDDNEMQNLRALMDEVFGEENFLAQVCWQKKYAPANDKTDFSATHEYLIAYTRNRQYSDSGRGLPTLNKLGRTEAQDKAYKNPDGDNRGVWKAGDYTCNKSADQRPNLYYPVIHPKTGEEIWPSKTRVWAYSQTVHQQHVSESRLWWGVNFENRVPSFKRFLSDVGGIIADTWWTWEDVGHTDEAKKEFRSLFPESGDAFDTPKPTRLMKRILELATEANTDDIVLDFFAGSGTMGQAVLAANVESGGSRRFILVQIDERLSEGSEARKVGLKTISSVTKERIRRVSKKLKADDATGDLGFRVLKLAKSNVVRWRGDKATSESLDDLIAQMQSTLVPGWKTEDVLTELMLLEGYPLDSSKTQSPDFDSNLVYAVTHPDKQTRLLVCLDDALEEATIEQLTSLPDLERKTFDFICLDAALTDQLKARLADKVRVKTI